MEVSAAARNAGVTLSPVASSLTFEPSREGWRIVSEHSVRNSGEHGRESLDINFCSITVDGALDNDILQQRLHSLVKQREELQNMELQLRAQVTARFEIVRLQNTFDDQIKDHANANAKLQEQVREKEQKIHELERKMDEKERELHAIRLDHEAALVKEDLSREQNKELQSYRREKDNTKAERAQYMKKIHGLQEHIQEKDRQFTELREQYRAAQETVLFKDEQVREAQTWISRAQEINSLQTTTNHTLQADLRERTEQYNQLWLGCQRQLGEIERLRLLIQQIQLETADAREKSGIQSDGSHISHINSNDASRLEHANGIQLEVNVCNSPTANTGSLENGNSGTSEDGALTQNEQVYGAAIAPSSLFGMPSYLLKNLYSFGMHQHGLHHSSHVTQSPFQSLPAMSSVQNWQGQQSLPGGEHMPIYNQYTEQAKEQLSTIDSHYDHEALAMTELVHRANYVDANIKAKLDAVATAPLLSGDIEVQGPVNESHDKAQSQLNLQQISSQFHEALRMDPTEHGNDSKEKELYLVSNHGVDVRNAVIECSGFAIGASSPEGQTHSNFSETTSSTAFSDASTNAFVSMEQKSNVGGIPGESYLLDERALLASITRTIGSGGRIRISSTLPNRLEKMLAPLHWDDYKKKYGKLDDFVANHPDLFSLEGHYIQLREGAQKIIAATATVAKVATEAAAVPSSFSSLMPSVAVTPMAHSHRLKKSPLQISDVNAETRPVFTVLSLLDFQMCDHSSQLSAMQSQNLNGSTFQIAGGVSNVKIASNLNNHIEPTGSVAMPGWSNMSTVGNGTAPDRIDFPLSKGPSHGGTGMSAVGPKQSRTSVAASNPRRS